MTPFRLLGDSFADKALPNAQMGNAREIIRRLDPARFHVSVFVCGEPDTSIAQRPNTRLIPLPSQRQTARIFREFVFGNYDVLFYLKSSPATKWYMRLPPNFKHNRISIGTIESQSDLRNERTITPEAVRVWEQTVLRCDYLFSSSPSVQQSLRTEYGLSSEIEPTGVDTHFFQPAGDSPPKLFFFQAEDGIRDVAVTGVQTCALPISFQRRGSGRTSPKSGSGDRGSGAGSRRLPRRHCCVTTRRSTGRGYGSRP